jgi:methionyl aminopeptidase
MQQTPANNGRCPFDCRGVIQEYDKREGDILNIDVTVILDGWFGDTSRMFYVGEPSLKARKLTEVTYQALMAGIACVRPGGFLGDIGACIQRLAESAGYSVVKDFCGHGIGREFHIDPTVLHFGTAGTGDILQPGMIFTIEPMINAGKPAVRILPDGWTAVTRDRSLSAQFEHTVGVTDSGVEVFTLSQEEKASSPHRGTDEQGASRRKTALS